MGASCRWVAVAGLLPFLAVAQSTEITDFFNSANRCDYLIVTPSMFAEGAGQLAKYRNDFSNDDVTTARFVIMGTLAMQFPRTVAAPDSMLRESIAWALQKWALRPSYIVFIGDDSVKYVAGDSLPHHGGPMPTHIKWDRHERFIGDSLVKVDTTIEYSDNWYLMATDTSFPWDTLVSRPPPAFGRIPCERPEELSRYIDKIKLYDALGGAPWRNRVLFLTDDDWQGEKRDQINHMSCTNDVMEKMKGRFEKPFFLSRYPLDATFTHPAAAKTTFFSGINNGCGWMVYFGHGHPSQLTDEKFLSTADNQSFANPQKPVILFSMSCSNAAFYKSIDSSMAKAWLFSVNGGAVAYVASPIEEYANANTQLMNRLTFLDDSLPGTSIGKILAYSKLSDRNINGHNYEVLGDPAVRTSQRRVPMALRPSADGTIQCVRLNSFNNDDSLSWECSRSMVWYDSLRKVAVPYDTVLFSGTERFASGVHSITIPSHPENDTLKLVAYAWNQSGTESRTEISICQGCAVGVAHGEQAIARNGSSAAAFHVAVRPSRSMLFTFNPQRSASEITLYGLDGRQTVKVVVPAGQNRIEWDRTKLTSGTYVATMRVAGGNAASMRFIVP